jgi:hypothetical protein
LIVINTSNFTVTTPRQRRMGSDDWPVQSRDPGGLFRGWRGHYSCAAIASSFSRPVHYPQRTMQHPVAGARCGP